MENDGLGAAVERLNAGSPIPAIEPSQIEHMWEVVSRIPMDRRKNTAVGHASISWGYPGYTPEDPDEQIALITRFALLDALLERCILNDYMKTEPGRKHVFAAAATIPYEKDDLVEALIERTLRDRSPEVVEQIKERAKNEGRDIDRPKIDEKFINWIRTRR